MIEHMHKKFEINRTKIKGGCLSGRKAVTHNSKSDLHVIDYVTPNETLSDLTIFSASL